MIIFQIIFYILSFFVVWYSSGIIIDSVEKFAKRLNISSFALSFFVLGILTSIPEFAIGINSIINKTPEVFVGNLIGASLVLFIFIIPLMAIFGEGVKMLHNLSDNDMIFALLVVASPIFLIADNVLTRTEGVFLIIIYLILFYFIEKKKGLMEVVKDGKVFKEKHIIEDYLTLFISAIILFLASRYIVLTTVFLANYFQVSSFMISIIFLSLGTNIPEITLAIRSILMRKKEVALGDYLGSAAANTLFFGVFTLLNGARVNISSYSLKTLLITIFSLSIFYLFSKSKREISPKEGKILLLIYILFVLSEVVV